MLSKEICKRCCGKHASSGLEVIKWNEKDDENWTHGLVCCPCKGTITYREAFKDCPYALEHVMMREKAC